jgi:hypothetical protein
MIPNMPCVRSALYKKLTSQAFRLCLMVALFGAPNVLGLAQLSELVKKLYGESRRSHSPLQETLEDTSESFSYR